MKKNAYIVDTNFTMHRSVKFNPLSDQYGEDVPDLQELFCTCGAKTQFKAKIKRKVALHSEGMRQDESSLDKIVCSNCKEEFSEFNVARLLLPDTPKLTSIAFHKKKWSNHLGQSIVALIRERVYISYVREIGDLKNISTFDQITFNEETKEGHLFINNSIFPDENYMNTHSLTSDIDKSVFDRNISHVLSLSNLYKLNTFFGHLEWVDYQEVENAFTFFYDLQNHIPDFSEFKKLKFLYHLIDTYKIYRETSMVNGKPVENLYRMVEDEFSLESKLIKQKFTPGPYLDSVSKFAELFFTVTSYSNITTVYLTKGYEFLYNMIKLSFTCNPNVYKYFKATYPSKILEISTNYSRSGTPNIYTQKSTSTLKTKDASKVEEKVEPEIFDENNENYLKISNTINSVITKPADMECLKKFYERHYVSKLELEMLLSKYDEESIYLVFGMLSNVSKNDSISYKHIDHIIRQKLYKNYGNDFLNSYFDTVKTIQQIIDSQDNVVKYIQKRGDKISESEKFALQNYLKIKHSVIFEAKTPKNLKSIHDNMSAVYSVFQDADKAERYSIVIDSHKDLNCTINMVNFTVIPSAVELQKEHLVMKHCINTYLDRIASMNYVAISVYDLTSNERATLGIEVSGKGKSIKYTFNQLKGFQNTRASSYLINSVIEFIKIKGVNNSDSYYANDITPDSGRQKRMDDYLPTQAIDIIRTHVAKMPPEEKDKAFKFNFEQAQEKVNEIIQKNNINIK